MLHEAACEENSLQIRPLQTAICFHLGLAILTWGGPAASSMLGPQTLARKSLRTKIVLRLGNSRREACTGENGLEGQFAEYQREKMA